MVAQAGLDSFERETGDVVGLSDQEDIAKHPTVDLLIGGNLYT